MLKFNTFAEEIKHYLYMTAEDTIYMSWPVFIDEFTNIKDEDFDDGEMFWVEDQYILNLFKEYIRSVFKSEKHLPYKKLKENLLNKSVIIGQYYLDPKEEPEAYTEGDDMRAFTSTYSVRVFYEEELGWRLYFEFDREITYHE